MPEVRADHELGMYRFLAEINAHLEKAGDAEGAARFALRASMHHFQAHEGALAILPAGRARAGVSFSIPKGGSWDEEALTDFLARRNPRLPGNVLMAGLRRRGRPWAVLALRRSGSDFERGLGRALARAASAVSAMIERIDRDRILEVRSRIDRKILEQLDPIDLAYQILHGLRSLTAYDHSSALLMGRGENLEVVAEQIAWSKGKSRRIGHGIPLVEEVRAALATGRVFGFERQGERWTPWPDSGTAELAELLDYNRGRAVGDDGPRESTILCAPLHGRDGMMGLLKVAARSPGVLGPHEALLVERFLPQAAVAVRNSQHAEHLFSRLLEVEKKHAVANLTRGVSHDVNNALGTVLPLVQQMRADVGSGRLEAAVLAADLAQIEHSLQVCRRIFGGMLSFARGNARDIGEGDVRRALEGTLAILRDGMERDSVHVELQLDPRLPLARGRQGDLEQLFLNLLTNARDAMPGGGRLTLVARAVPEGIEVRIRDTGVGIPVEHRERIEESFFTTKPHGNGLGLPICRSILTEFGGDMEIWSAEGQGTEVRIRLPLSERAEAVERA